MLDAGNCNASSILVRERSFSMKRDRNGTKACCIIAAIEFDDMLSSCWFRFSNTPRQDFADYEYMLNLDDTIANVNTLNEGTWIKSIFC